MNYPSRTDNPDGREGWNQSPNVFSNATRQDFNGLANSRILRRSDSERTSEGLESEQLSDTTLPPKQPGIPSAVIESRDQSPAGQTMTNTLSCVQQTNRARADAGNASSFSKKAWRVFLTFGRFVGPGFMISVAYIDPGNYSTDVAAGASYRFKLLFVVFSSNLIAIYLQSLCIKLGTVTGLNLAQMCRTHFPKWLNLFLYLLAEGAIIATDIAEVIGTAIAINLLIPKIPLVAGCAISIVDVLLILIFYRPNGSMKGLRTFEMFVVALVLGVVICFIVQLSLIKDTSVGEVFRGYLPSSAIVQPQGLYQACGILGATVMPHSLYLGSGLVQPRLLEYDIKAGLASPHVPASGAVDSFKMQYRPSLPAIKICLKYSIVELAISLFTFALFINSSILVVAGASLSKIAGADAASLFGIHALLSSSISPAAGTVFALALLLSGVSAGIVCTIAGQMVSEGALNWSISPFLRRLITRSISITPSIIVAGAVGAPGLTAALNGSQVALSVALPFISAPVIYFTCRNKFMTVGVASPQHEPNHIIDDDNGNAHDIQLDSVHHNAEQARPEPGSLETDAATTQPHRMANHWFTTAFAVVIWIIIAVMNVANLVLLGLGRGG
ncbi:MAG: hypothetical protein M1818_001662 [Claussenomyces sp. TS43310]|nr:MAG: hypothetical protein M1818_001662 [Claussenomyces sp. TS43310]